LNKIKDIIDSYTHTTVFLLIVGLLAAIFFTATFLINRAISLDGGHWYFSGSLRLVYLILFFSIGFIIFRGVSYFKAVLKEYIDNFRFWTIAGTIGFGCFYSLLCYAADFSPAWVVATTWQITLISSLFVLSFFGKKLSKKIWIFTLIIFVGITLVNISHFDINNIEPLLLGFLPVLVASFCYPFGNQLVWEEKKKRIDKNKDYKVLNNTFVKVFLLTLGSFPLWIVLYFTTDATVPSTSQYINVAIVTLLSGVIATSLFLYARNHADTSSKLMLVDATQSGEVFFALVGELLFLNAALPNATGFVGLIVTVTGLILLTKSKE